MARKSSAALTAVVGVMAVAISACGTQTTPTAITSAGAGQPSSGQVVATRQVGNCLDGTSSSASHYAPRIQAVLAEAVAAWAARPSANPSGGVPAQFGLHFVLRSVTTSSYSTDGLSVDDTIPPVKALAPQPSPTADPSFDADIHTWTRALPGWKQTASSAAAAAAQLSAKVRQYPVARNTWSAIYSCVSAAVQQLGPAQGANTRLAVISDMQNNEPVVGLNLAGAEVLMVTICPANVSTGCPQRFATARSYLMRHGASSVQIVSVDAVTPGTFDDFWRA